jgi:hypothetical protein
MRMFTYQELLEAAAKVREFADDLVVPVLYPNFPVAARPTTQSEDIWAYELLSAALSSPAQVQRFQELMMDTAVCARDRDPKTCALHLGAQLIANARQFQGPARKFSRQELAFAARELERRAPEEWARLKRHEAGAADAHDALFRTRDNLIIVDILASLPLFDPKESESRNRPSLLFGEICNRLNAGTL